MKTNLIETAPENIGQGTKIWHMTHIREGAIIGVNCSIGDFCYIDKFVIIGNGVKIQNHCNIYLGVELENFVFIGPNVTFTNVKRPRSRHPVNEHQYLETRVGVGASIGASSTIICGINIYKYAFVGAGSLVTRSVLPYNIVYGTPARVQGAMCACGNHLWDINDDFDGEMEVCCSKCGIVYLMIEPVNPKTGMVVKVLKEK